MSLSQATFSTSLYDETTFYAKFRHDLLHSTNEVVIESPFITTERTKTLYPIFEKLVNHGVRLYVVTRDPREHSETMEEQSETEIHKLEALGVQVFLCIGNHHRKLAIIDRTILWEGSLNILSQIHSREFMRRLEGGGFAVDLFNFIGYKKYL